MSECFVCGCQYSLCFCAVEHRTRAEISKRTYCAKCCPVCNYDDAATRNATEQAKEGE